MLRAFIARAVAEHDRGKPIRGFANSDRGKAEASVRGRLFSDPGRARLIAIGPGFAAHA